MNVSAPSIEAIRMNRNVTQDHLITVVILLDYICSNIIEVRQVVLDFEDVVVAFDKYESTLQSAQEMAITAVNAHIAEQVNTVTRINQRIMVCDDSLIVFL